MNDVVPFLKWPGGKRWLAPVLAHILRHELHRQYFEPFAGAASVFLRLNPKRAILADINEELIEALTTVRSQASDVVDAVWRLSNSEECYYRVRSSNPRTPIGRAARFVYLNRTCWGGIYRLNRDGQFNVPFGNSGRRLCSKAHVESVARKMRNARIVVSDFEPVVSNSRKGDVVYADPPYTTRGKNNGFVRYNESLFSWDDQIRLAVVTRKAARRGVFVAVSNMYHKEVLSLYKGWWAMKVERTSCVSRNEAGRKRVQEVVVFSRQPSQEIYTEGLRVFRIR